MGGCYPQDGSNPPCPFILLRVLAFSLRFKEPRQWWSGVSGADAGVFAAMSEGARATAGCILAPQAVVGVELSFSETPSPWVAFFLIRRDQQGIRDGQPVPLSLLLNLSTGLGHRNGHSPALNKKPVPGA